MNRIITIGREFGSGGRELGRKLAAELDIPYYDQEILTQIAQKTELAEEYVSKVLETERFFYFPVTVGHSFTCMPNLAFDFHEAIYREQHNIIREMAARSDCIIIGRCADYILRDLHPLRLFVYASMQHKIERCRARNAEEADLSDKELKKPHSAHRAGARQVLPLLHRACLGRAGKLRPLHQYLAAGDRRPRQSHPAAGRPLNARRLLPERHAAAKKTPALQSGSVFCPAALLFFFRRNAGLHCHACRQSRPGRGVNRLFACSS